MAARGAVDLANLDIPVLPGSAKRAACSSAGGGVAAAATR